MLKKALALILGLVLIAVFVAFCGLVLWALGCLNLYLGIDYCGWNCEQNPISSRITSGLTLILMFITLVFVVGLTFYIAYSIGSVLLEKDDN